MSIKTSDFLICNNTAVVNRDSGGGGVGKRKE